MEGGKTVLVKSLLAGEVLAEKNFSSGTFPDWSGGKAVREVENQMGS